MQNTLKIFFQNYNVALDKVSVLSYAWCLWLKNEKFVDKGKTLSPLLAELSKAFDCLPHDPISAKLNAYAFNFSAARLIQSYLSTESKETK